MGDVGQRAPTLVVALECNDRTCELTFLYSVAALAFCMSRDPLSTPNLRRERTVTRAAALPSSTSQSLVSAKVATPVRGPVVSRWPRFKPPLVNATTSHACGAWLLTMRSRCTPSFGNWRLCLTRVRRSSNLFRVCSCVGFATWNAAIVMKRLSRCSECDVDSSQLRVLTTDRLCFDQI